MKSKKTILLLILTVSVLYAPSVYANCVLGPKVSDDINGALNILKIVAPLIVFAMTLYETITALTKGDGAEGFKAVFTKLKKRFIYMVLLIFIPTIVQLMLNAMGLTDNCKLGEAGTTVGEKQDQENKKNETKNQNHKDQNNADNPKNSVCAAHNGAGKQGECNAVSGCSFDPGTNTCNSTATRDADDSWNTACAAHNGAGKRGECEAAGCSFSGSTNTCNPK